MLIGPTQRVALEVRSREGVTKIPKGDASELQKKKTKYSSALAVYCSYGRPTAVKNKGRTRILVADPPGEALPIEPEAVARVVFGYYEGVCARLGLWEFRSRLRDVRAQLETGARLGAIDRTAIHDPIVDGVAI